MRDASKMIRLWQPFFPFSVFFLCIHSRDCFIQVNYYYKMIQSWYDQVRDTHSNKSRRAYVTLTYNKKYKQNNAHVVILFQLFNSATNYFTTLSFVNSIFLLITLTTSSIILSNSRHHFAELNDNFGIETFVAILI